MESINGLPAHPLFVHAPVVLIPLSALLALVIAARPRWRGRAGWALAASAIVALVTTQLAVSSGYAFDEVVAGAADTDDHRALGEATRNLVILFALGAVITAVLDRLGSGHGRRLALASTVAMVTTAVLGVLATVWVARTGDEGARLVWDGVLSIRFI